MQNLQAVAVTIPEFISGNILAPFIRGVITPFDHGYDCSAFVFTVVFADPHIFRFRILQPEGFDQLAVVDIRKEAVVGVEVDLHILIRHSEGKQPVFIGIILHLDFLAVHHEHIANIGRFGDFYCDGIASPC